VNVTLKFGLAATVAMPRPEPFSEVKPGIFYVDLSRFDAGAFSASREKLAAAKGIVFDMRGYPSRDANAIVRYWLAGPDTAQWMIVPRFDKPFGRYDTGWSFGWQVERDASIEKPKKVLLMDGRALSYAESLIGYFQGQKTGRILGERSGGANGNVDLAALPSGLNYMFTGMKVTRHDGSVFHREGFAPDEEVVPTTAGLAAGRDEVLERAIADLLKP
jgi:C-terminal processing protease CtpA/Prc